MTVHRPSKAPDRQDFFRDLAVNPHAVGRRRTGYVQEGGGYLCAHECLEGTASWDEIDHLHLRCWLVRSKTGQVASVHGRPTPSSTHRRRGGTTRRPVGRRGRSALASWPIERLSPLFLSHAAPERSSLQSRAGRPCSSAKWVLLIHRARGRAHFKGTSETTARSTARGTGSGRRQRWRCYAAGRLRPSITAQKVLHVRCQLH